MTAGAREFEASTGQRLLWLLDHYRGSGGTVNAPLAWRLRGAIDVRALQAALDALVARHEALRTTYAARGRRLVAEVLPARPLELERRAPSAGASAAEREAAVLREARERARAEMDATTAPLVATLWEIGPDDRLLLLAIHHLATDFFSNMLITRDLGWLYDVATAGAAPPPPIAWQYADWAEHQRAEFAGGRVQRLRSFWRRRLDGAQAPLLPQGAQQGSEEAAAGATAQVTLDVDPVVVERLRGVALRSRATMFPVMLAAFYAHLLRTTGQRDLAVASLFANRLRPEVQETVGFFVNMIVLRAEIADDASFGDLVRVSRATVMGALAHADLPYHMLPPHTVRTQVDGRVARVDDVVFQYLEAPAGRRGALALEPLEFTVNAGRFALELVVHNQSECMLRYDPAHIDSAWAADFLAGYGASLDELSQAPNAPVVARPDPVSTSTRGSSVA